MSETKPILAVLGGTGNLGEGLAIRWARAGHDVIIGSRTAEKAADAVRRFSDRAPAARLRGLENPAAAAAADIVALTVPFEHQQPTLRSVRDAVQGKILIDVTVPLVPPQVMRVQLPPEGSAARAAQNLLGENVRVVSAFQSVAADHLADPDHEIDCDVLVAGDDADARRTVLGLVEAAGLRGWHVGSLDNAAVAEAFTSVLIFLNSRYGIEGAGIRITGTPSKDPDAGRG